MAEIVPEGYTKILNRRGLKEGTPVAYIDYMGKLRFGVSAGCPKHCERIDSERMVWAFWEHSRSDPLFVETTQHSVYAKIDKEYKLDQILDEAEDLL